MSGINSLSGLNTVSVDFRPAITTVGRNKGNAQPVQPEINVAPEEAPPEMGQARSVVRELDVLLLNAAGKSVAADAAGNVKTVGDSLRDMGVLTQKEASKLESLAEDAAAKLKALDKFSGRDLAKALMQDKKTGETVWSKGFFGLSSAAKAVKAAIEAQQTLSAELGKYTNRLAGNAQVDPAKQEQYTELLFQCDRRASEIDSVVFRMYDLAQKDVVNGAAGDPQTKALLDATFKELMPREAIMMHGTAEAFVKMNETMGEQLRPLAEKLDAFAANGGQVLGKEELRALLRDMATMKNAIANVRANGIEVTHAGKDGSTYVTRTEVDKSLLDGMEKVLDAAAGQISRAKKTAVAKAREAFLMEVRTSLTPVDAGGNEVSGVGASDSIVTELLVRRNELVRTLNKFATGEKPMKDFDAAIDACIAKFRQELFENIENRLPQQGVDPSVAQGIAKTLGGLHIVKAQFKEMMASTAKLLSDDAEAGLATSDVRRIMLGETGLSNVVGAKALGFKAGDVDPATEESNIVSSRPLGAGAGGKTYLLTTKSGGELVFKPDLDGRLGLNEILLGMGGAYRASQNTANLNLATQDTAKAFGCGDVVVKYSVGSHDGQFGSFMGKAKGVSGADFSRKSASGGGGVPPAELHKITDPAEQTRIKGDVARKLNQLMWLDLITGQGDRHWSNYFIHIDPTTHEATVNAIDNDASFGENRTGLMKFALDKEQTARFEQELKNVCQKIHGRGWKAEYDNRVSQDPAIVRNNGTITIDLTRAQSHEAKMALIGVLGLQSVALPEEIDRDFYDHLMEMEADPAKKQAYLDSIAPRISPAALRATEARLDEAIAHAHKLAQNGKVYGKAQWQNEDNLKAMTGSKATLTITKADGSKFKAENTIECVREYNQRKCPSFFKREFLHQMFNKPE
jgi:hypothetical protein